MREKVKTTNSRAHIIIWKPDEGSVFSYNYYCWDFFFLKHGRLETLPNEPEAAEADVEEAQLRT